MELAVATVAVILIAVTIFVILVAKKGGDEDRRQQTALNEAIKNAVITDKKGR